MTKTIARATNDRGQTVELEIDKAPEHLNPWPFRDGYKLKVDGKTVLDADFGEDEAAKAFLNACRVEEDHD